MVKTETGISNGLLAALAVMQQLEPQIVTTEL
jgi:hypothetical protein